jgi:hypothetical protein
VAENIDTHEKLKRILNPKRGTIDIVKNDKLERRIFFGVVRSQPDAGKVIRIEDGQRTLVAKYAYDPYGRVSSYWAGGESQDKQIDFVYDRSGRHRKDHQETSPLPGDQGHQP